MSNEAVITRWIEEFINKANEAVAEEIIAADFVMMDPVAVPEQPGREGYLELMRSYWAFAPDLTLAVTEQIPAGDRVTVRWVFTGTHQGEFAGQAPTGRSFEVEGISILRLAGGQICEQILAWDALGLSRQLGISLI
ncbi:MAG: ester cyclase [Sporichthyaceae bacterium]